MENDPLKTFKKKRAMEFFRSKGQHKSQLHAISIEEDKTTRTGEERARRERAKNSIKESKDQISFSDVLNF